MPTGHKSKVVWDLISANSRSRSAGGGGGVTDWPKYGGSRGCDYLLENQW